MKKIFILLICFCLFGCQSTQKNETSSNEEILVETHNNEDNNTQDLNLNKKRFKKIKVKFSLLFKMKQIIKFKMNLPLHQISLCKKK